MPTLTWIGKEKVVNHHLEVPYRVLEHRYGYRADNVEDKSFTGSGNMIIHGDNLEALKALLPEYEGRIKCIYIDPPYNTGNEGWVYNDNVNHPKIQKWLGEVVGKQEEDFTRHDKWLCMMYPRLRLLQRLLSEDGAIFISIDDNELANLKLLCDEVFGARNFVEVFSWMKTETPANLAYKTKKAVEYVVCYMKESNKTKFTGLSKTSSSNNGLMNQSNSIHELVFPANKVDTKLKDGIYKAGKYGTSVYDIELLEDTEVKGGLFIKPVRLLGKFKWGQENLDKEIENGTIVSIKTIAFSPSYDKVDYEPEVPWNFISRKFGVQTNETASTQQGNIFGKKVFDFPKPPSLVEYLISFLCDKNSIILDSFAGSGTTAHAVLNLNKQDNGNRKFILVEMEDYADSITAERVKKVIKGYKSDKETLLYSQELKPSNIKKWEEFENDMNGIKKEYQNEYDDFKKVIEDNTLRLIGIAKGNEEGTSGEFDFYELGDTLFNADGTLNEAVGEDRIREYIYYTDTKQHLSRKREAANRYLLDTWNGVAYYFYYEQGKETTLTYDKLSIIKQKAERYIVYADTCTIDKDYLNEKSIIFKKIPRDIQKF